MICLQIPGGHGACGHGAAEGSRVGTGRAGHGGEPREICEEGGDCGNGGGVQTVQKKLTKNLLNQEKMKKESQW